MLMQNFLSYKQLRINKHEWEGLVKVLALFDCGDLEHVPAGSVGVEPPKGCHGFNMTWFECNTARCIGGWVRAFGGKRFRDSYHRNKALNALYFPMFKNKAYHNDYGKVTVAQAAIALRSFLTTGDAKWDEAVAKE